MMKERSVQIFLVLSIVLANITAVAFYWGNQERYRAREWVSHTNEVIDKVQTLNIYFKNLEIDQREYAITGNIRYREAFDRDVTDVRMVIQDIVALLIDSETQAKIIQDSIIPLTDKRIQEIQLSFQTVGRKNLADLEDDEDAEILDRQLSDLTNRERELLKVRMEKLASANNFVERLIYLSIFFSMLIGLMAYVTIRQFKKKNQELIESLKNVNQNLEQTVQEQTNSIREINEDLQAKNDNLEALNEELTASEEELRSGMEYINALRADLEESEKLHRLLTENSQDVIALFSIENKFLYVSPSVEKILGYEPHELIGTNGAEIVHPEDLARLATPEEIAGSESRLHVPHFRLRTKGGYYIWIEAQSNPIFDEQGNLMGIQTINRDISERKEIEYVLRESKESAEAATKAKSQFLSAMSHEIRTPMNAVIGLTNILLEESPLPRQVEKLQLLKFSGENLLSIINDILDFSKIEAGKMALELIDFDLHNLVDNVAKLSEKKAQEKNIRLEVSMASNVPAFVQGDPVRLAQILNNFLSNAIKFTEKGYVALKVASLHVVDKTHKISFSVKDTGIGIAPESLNSIFESFTQASTDTTRKYGGTGLGLTITKRLAELMGGEISVVSAVGYGSTFELELLMQEGENKQKGSSPGQAVGIRKDDHVRVLLVEDNAINVVVAKNFLERWNIEVDVVVNGLLAVEKVKSKDYQMVLMDIEMPEMDGYEATRTIRKMDDDYFRKLPIIALTASAMNEVRDSVMSSGMNDMVTKPFNPQELNATIQRHLKRNHAESESDFETALDQYTQGDEELKKELIDLIALNLEEFVSMAGKLSEDGDVEKFNQFVHKSKTSIALINNTEFSSLIASVQDGNPPESVRVLARKLQSLSSKVQQQIAKVLEKH